MKSFVRARQTALSTLPTRYLTKPLSSSALTALARLSQSGHEQHLFQPVASQPSVSPMRRTTTWLTALRAREKAEREWKESNPGSSASAPSSLTYSYTSVKTRERVSKSRDDSFTYAILPFKDDPWFMDAYINASGRLRIGQIFQDLDALAGVIAYRHCSPAEPVIVTASVDRIYMLKRLDDVSSCNVTLSGSVTWTGRSSMEITIKAATHRGEFDKEKILEESDIRDEDVFLTANFTFVARDPETQKAFPINMLVPRNEKEEADFVLAEKFNNQKKIAASQTGLQLSPPSEEEAKVIHDMWIKEKDYESHPETRSKSVIPMSTTRIFSTSIMQPQYRNRHSYMIFGGYLLRETFELAYACAAAFSHSQPRYVSLDSTTFRNPVPVGSVLYLTATVAYIQNTKRRITTQTDHSTETSDVPGTLIQIRVDSTVRNLDHGTTTDTGQFTYSYFVPVQGLEILPQTYGEMMEYLEGRRKAQDTADYFQERYSKDATQSVVSE
jgi:acyl-coenzyme A thioesterase 9